MVGETKLPDHCLGKYMTNLKNFHQDHLDYKRGFTLLELLVVTLILAIIGGGVILSLNNAEEDASFKIAQNEILEIKKAILQFKQDTGYFPKQGPFNLGIDCSVPSNLAEQKFCSPVNFEQLYSRPDILALDPQEHLENWNQDTKRGWRGPYLNRQGEGLVDIGADLNSNGSGYGTAGTVLNELKGVADPFVAKSVGSYFVWRIFPGDAPYNLWGRPYLYIFDSNNLDHIRIIGLGPNGTYDCDRDSDTDCDGADINPILDLCVPPSNADDIVLCIQQ